MKPSSAAGAKGKGVKDHQLPEWPEIRPLVQLGERMAAKDVWRAMTVRAIKPTAKMAANAKLGLELRRKFGRGGTEVGVRRAEGLIAGEDLSPRDVRAIYSYFARHEVDKQTRRYEWGSKSNPSPGYIAWLLWGGDDGKRWAERQRNKLSG